MSPASGWTHHTTRGQRSRSAQVVPQTSEHVRGLVRPGRPRDGSHRLRLADVGMEHARSGVTVEEVSAVRNRDGVADVEQILHARRRKLRWVAITCRNSGIASSAALAAVRSASKLCVPPIGSFLAAHSFCDIARSPPTITRHTGPQRTFEAGTNGGCPAG